MVMLFLWSSSSSNSNNAHVCNSITVFTGTLQILPVKKTSVVMDSESATKSVHFSESVRIRILGFSVAVSDSFG